MNQSNIFFEFGVSDAIFPKFSLKCNNLPINFFRTYISYSKMVEIYGVSQKILQCDFRIPESRELFPGLPSATWHRQNFPDPANKQKFVIGCEPNPKVIDKLFDNKNIILIKTRRWPEVDTLPVTLKAVVTKLIDR